MDEVRSFEGTSVFSSVTGVPAYITAQYTPLVGVLRRTDVEFPDRREPEPNSQGYFYILCVYCVYLCCSTCKPHCLQTRKKVTQKIWLPG